MSNFVHKVYNNIPAVKKSVSDIANIFDSYKEPYSFVEIRPQSMNIHIKKVVEERYRITPTTTYLEKILMEISMGLYVL